MVQRGAKQHRTFFNLYVSLNLTQIYWIYFMYPSGKELIANVMKALSEANQSDFYFFYCQLRVGDDSYWCKGQNQTHELTAP